MSDVKITENSKAKFFIGTNKVDHLTDVYKEILGVENVSPSTAVGGEQEVKEKELLEGKIKYAGSIDHGTVEFKYAIDDTSLGQQALTAARHDNVIYNFKIEKNNKKTPTGKGDCLFFKARITAAGEVDIQGGEVAMVLANLCLINGSLK